MEVEKLEYVIRLGNISSNISSGIFLPTVERALKTDIYPILSLYYIDHSISYDLLNEVLFELFLCCFWLPVSYSGT